MHYRRNDIRRRSRVEEDRPRSAQRAAHPDGPPGMGRERQEFTARSQHSLARRLARTRRDAGRQLPSEGAPRPFACRPWLRHARVPLVLSRSCSLLAAAAPLAAPLRPPTCIHRTHRSQSSLSSNARTFHVSVHTCRGVSRSCSGGMRWCCPSSSSLTAALATTRHLRCASEHHDLCLLTRRPWAFDLHTVSTSTGLFWGLSASNWA